MNFEYIENQCSIIIHIPVNSIHVKLYVYQNTKYMYIINTLYTYIHSVHLCMDKSTTDISGSLVHLYIHAHKQYRYSCILYSCHSYAHHNTQFAVGYIEYDMKKDDDC